MPNTLSLATPAACGPGKALGCQGQVAFRASSTPRSLHYFQQVAFNNQNSCHHPRTLGYGDLLLNLVSFCFCLVFSFQNRDLESKKEAWVCFCSVLIFHRQPWNRGHHGVCQGQAWYPVSPSISPCWSALYLLLSL